MPAEGGRFSSGLTQFTPVYCCKKLRRKTGGRPVTTPTSTTRHDTTRHDTTRHDTTRHDTTRHDTTRQNTRVQYSTVQYSTVQYSTVQYSSTVHNTARADNNAPRNEQQYSIRRQASGVRIVECMLNQQLRANAIVKVIQRSRYSISSRAMRTCLTTKTNGAKGGKAVSNEIASSVVRWPLQTHQPPTALTISAQQVLEHTSATLEHATSVPVSGGLKRDVQLDAPHAGSSGRSRNHLDDWDVRRRNRGDRNHPRLLRQQLLQRLEKTSCGAYTCARTVAHAHTRTHANSSDNDSSYPTAHVQDALQISTSTSLSGTARPFMNDPNT
jgi:hypothetical protein